MYNYPNNMNEKNYRELNNMFGCYNRLYKKGYTDEEISNMYRRFSREIKIDMIINDNTINNN